MFDIVIAQPIRFEERSGGVGPVHFETLIVTAMALHQAEVMEHCAHVQQFRVVGQLLALTAQGTEQEYPA